MTLTNILIAIIIIGFILSRQLRERPVREDKGYTTVIILMAIGVVQVAQVAEKTADIPLGAYGVLAVSLLVGAGFGMWRAVKTHLWRDHGTLVRQGNWITVVLWIVGMGLHIGSDVVLERISPHAATLGSSSIVLYIAISLVVQRYVIMQRAEHAIERHQGEAHDS